MGIAEPAYTFVGPIRVDRRAADRRNSAAALLAAVTSGLAVTRDTIFARQRFEEALAGHRPGEVRDVVRRAERARLASTS